MLHDDITGRSLNTTTETDRRNGPRLPYPSELVLAWHCSLPDTTRYKILDVSDGGFRIRTSVPLVEGMTGTVLTILPEGHQLRAGVMVVWCKKSASEDGYDAGLRRL